MEGVAAVAGGLGGPNAIDMTQAHAVGAVWILYRVGLLTEAEADGWTSRVREATGMRA